MQIVDLHPVFFHHAKGNLQVFSLEILWNQNLLLEPPFHGGFVGRASRRGGCPYELCSGLLQSSDQELEPLPVGFRGTILLVVFPAVHIPQAPVEMNEIPSFFAQPLLDLGNPPDGRTGVPLVTLDFRDSLQVFNDVRRISDGDRVPHDQNLGEVVCPKRGEAERIGEIKKQKKVFHLAISVEEEHRANAQSPTERMGWLAFSLERMALWCRDM